MGITLYLLDLKTTIKAIKYIHQESVYLGYLTQDSS